jgi:hypothetical protein
MKRHRLGRKILSLSRLDSLLKRNSVMPTQNSSSVLIPKPFENSGIETLEPMVLLSACGLNGDIQNVDIAMESCEVEDVIGGKFVAYEDASTCSGKFFNSNLIDVDSCNIEAKYGPDPYLSKGGCGSEKDPSEPWDVAGNKVKHCSVKTGGMQWGGEESTDAKFASSKSCGGKLLWGDAGYERGYGSVAQSFNWSDHAGSSYLGHKGTGSADSQYDSKLDSSAESVTVSDAVLVGLSNDVDDSEFREIDGAGNNLLNPHFGAANTELIRLVPGEASAGDPVDGVLGDGLPSVREVSNIVNDQDVSIVNDRGTSDYLWAWGQFIDHDITLTSAGAVNGEKAPIAIPLGDPEFDPQGTGTATMNFTRSDYQLDVDGVRQFENDITAFIDGSQIYGSDDETASMLRDAIGGKLQVSEGNLLPLVETSGEATDHHDGGKAFVAGDIRVNENAALTSLHTLFVREHNRIAEEIAATDYAYSDLSDPMIDEQIYQRARGLVSAQLQSITYEEFLPALLGKNAIGQYKGYDPDVDPAIANEFSTAAFRIGHTMLSDSIQRLDESGNEIAEGDLELRDAFFRPDKVAEAGIDPILRGLSAQASQEVDPYLVDDVRNFLFGVPGSGGLDLASLNLQRGRDHGLPSYVDARAALGLTEVYDFSDISSDPEVVSRLQEAYQSVDKVDFWVGGLAEDHVHGSSTGELFSNVITDQFTRLRDGDRFYYENSLSTSEMEWVESRKLSDVVRDNTAVENLADNVFFVEDNGNRYA